MIYDTKNPIEVLELTIPESVIVPHDIIPLQKLHENVIFVEDLLKVRVGTDNMTEMSTLIEELTAWYAMIGNMVASANFYRDVAYMLEYNKVVSLIKGKELPAEFKGVVSPSILKEYIVSRNASFNHLAKKCERLNSGVTHRMEAVRTMLTTEREVFRITAFGVSQK